MRSTELHKSPVNKAVLVAGFGFFVDAFDLLLFNVLRIPSLKDLGLTGKELTQTGEYLLAIQMLGMMIGGVISGIVGDRRGRISVLFGSILLYSIANLANAWVDTIPAYAAVRFLAGVGLAGELGAGITLVSESMTVEHRGYGTILVATLGACGAIAAGLAGDLLPWRTSYIIAGSAGLLLLLLRMSSLEPGMFRQLKENRHVRKGSFQLLLSNPQRLRRYLACIMVGVPIWYCVGMLISLAPELAAEHGISGLRLATCFILFQVGIAAGDLSSGVISQLMKTRKKVLIGFMSIALLAVAAYFGLFYAGGSPQAITYASLAMGYGCGYMSVFVTTTAESFGTNLRVTVTATVTNFMRGAVTVLIPLQLWLEHSFDMTLGKSLIVTGGIVFFLSFISAGYLKETFGKPLDYLEE